MATIGTRIAAIGRQLHAEVAPYACDLNERRFLVHTALWRMLRDDPELTRARPSHAIEREVAAIKRARRPLDADPFAHLTSSRNRGAGDMHGDHELFIGCGKLPGTLVVPPSARGLIIFAHGSGSSRLSPRNAYAAERLNARGFATLLFDLLTQAEADERQNVFDIALLAERVGEAIDWARAQREIARLPIGLFGASTGAAAAIAAAAANPDKVRAVVSRGGRPDLAGRALKIVEAPTLLIVGGHDIDVIGLNKAARLMLKCENELVIVPGAGHLFDEPGTLDLALSAAGDWFDTYLAGVSHERRSVR